MQKQAIDFIKKVLPTPAIDALRATRRIARAIAESEASRPSPHGVQLGAPVVQLYIAEDGIQTSIGFNNFYSVLLPDLEQAATVEISLHDADGRRIAQLTRDIAHFGAGTVEVSDLFAAAGIKAPYGIIATRLVPRAPEIETYATIGEARCFFFVFYSDASGSIGQVHPNAVLRKRAVSPRTFESNQMVSTHGLTELSLYQFNPGGEAATFTHALTDLATGAAIASQTSTLPAFGARRVRFPIADLKPLPQHFGLRIDGFFGTSKPILRRVFADGSSSFSHC